MDSSSNTNEKGLGNDEAIFMESNTQPSILNIPEYVNPVNSKRLEWALKLASYGLGVFPVKFGAKEPWVDGPSWIPFVTTDPDTIRGYADRYPGCNFGVCPGAGFVVIDVDVKGGKTGDVTFAKLEAAQEFCQTISGNPTLAVKSPSGGIHYYLKSPIEAGNSHSFGTDIDVRGVHGYVLGPGCELIEGLCKPSDVPGEYTVENDVPIVDAPDWVVERLGKHIEPDSNAQNPLFDLDSEINIESARAWLRIRKPAIEGEEGDRHSVITAMMVMDFCISEEKTLELMMEEWNDTCIPPWDEGELAVKVGNAWRYRRERPGIKGSGLMDLFEEEYRAGVVADEPNPPVSNEEQGDDFDKHIFVGDGILNRGKRREVVIPGLLLAHGITACIGKRGLGKTVVMVDMAIRIAFDMDWHGEPIKTGYHVVYLCGEDDVGAEEHVRAWMIAHSVDSLPDRFIFLDIVPDLLDPATLRSGPIN